MTNKNLQKFNVGDVVGNLTIIQQVMSLITFYPKTGKSNYRARYKYQCTCGRVNVITGKTLRVYQRKVLTCVCPSCAYRTRPQSTRRISLEMDFFTTNIKDIYIITQLNQRNKYDSWIRS